VTNLNLLYVITDLALGGVPLHLHRLVKAMRERGHEVRVISLAPDGPVGRTLRDDGVEVLTCDGGGGWDFRVIGRLARIIRATQPDIIHAMLFHANLAAKWAARRVGFPANRVLCEIQTVEVERRWHLWVDRWTYPLCRLMIGNSPSVVEHLATQARIPRHRLHLLRGGIDPSPYRDARPVDGSTLALPENVRVALWVGRLDPVKGLTILVDAFPSVVREVDAHLLLAGDGPMRTALTRQIHRLGLADRVHLLGARSDVPGLLKLADVFVFPSRTEGLPNSLLEAMAAGCAIVTTDAPGCRDLIEHQQTGLRVPYGDTRALSDAIVTVLQDPTLAARLGQCAADEVERHWHVDRTHEAYSALYRAV